MSDTGMNNTRRVADLDTTDQNLLNEARAMTARSYSPYSNYAVGAAAVSSSGMIHRGANVENASYGMTVCAEVGAITAAHAAGDPEIETIAIVAGKRTNPGEQKSDAEPLGMPCGRCRQMIHEIAARSGHDVRVLVAGMGLDTVLVATSRELLPDPFGPEHVNS